MAWMGDVLGGLASQGPWFKSGADGSNPQALAACTERAGCLLIRTVESSLLPKLPSTFASSSTASVEKLNESLGLLPSPALLGS